MKLSHHDKHMLAAKSGADIRTVQRWWDGQRVARVSEAGLRLAAEQLGIERRPVSPEPERKAS